RRGVQRGCGLHGEVVAGDVPRCDIRDALHGPLPPDVVQSWHCIDEVAVDRLEAGRAHLLDRREGSPGIVHASEKREDVRLEALDTDAHAVEAGAKPGARPLASRARRVRLQGDLRTGRHVEGAADLCGYRGKQLRIDERWGTAADEDRLQPHPGELPAQHANLVAQRGHVLMLSRGTRHRHEVAVLTFALAERDVHVEGAHLLENRARRGIAGMEAGGNRRSRGCVHGHRFDWPRTLPRGGVGPRGLGFRRRRLYSGGETYTVRANAGRFTTPNSA